MFTIASIFTIFLCGYLMIFIPTTHQININTTNSFLIIPLDARALNGSQSNLFPKNSLVMLLLYGHSDVPFSLSDLVNYYGYEISSFRQGNIIISKDMKTSGIVVDDTYFLYMIPSQEITLIPISQIDEYFPKGYSMKANDEVPDSQHIDLTFFNVNNTNSCDLCRVTMDSNLRIKQYEKNKYIIVDIYNEDRTEWIFFGYLKSYDPNYDRGTVCMYFYMHSTKGNIFYSDFIDEEENKFMNFTDSTKESINSYNFSTRVKGNKTEDKSQIDISFTLKY